MVAKIFATTTFVTSAAYAARQASKQEKVERYSRKIEMELVAIDPFIDSLDDEKKSLIKEEIARKIFGNADAMEISSKDEAYTAMDKLTSIEEVLNSLVTVIGKLPKWKYRNTELSTSQYHYCILIFKPFNDTRTIGVS